MVLARVSTAPQSSIWIDRIKAICVIFEVVMTQVEVPRIFYFGKTGATIVLRPASALLITKVLSSPGSKESCKAPVSVGDERPAATALLTNMLRIFNAAAHLRRIVRSRELILCSRDRTLTSMEYLNTVSPQAKNADFLVTFGRNDGCSSITELLRNFCTRQSLP